MNYGEILKRAWQTIWKHKILWLFGLLASCTANSGGGGGGGGGRSTSNYNYNNGDFFQGNPFSYNFEREFGNMPSFNHFFSGNNEGWIIALIIVGVLCLVLILSLLFIALGSAGEIGLSRGSWLADEGQSKITFSTLWQSIKKPFWRVFLMHFLLGIIGLIFGVLIAGVVILSIVFTLGIALICMLPFLCIFGIVGFVAGILISIMMQLMIPMMVNEDVGLADAVKKAFELLKLNFWPTVLMGIILFAIQFAVGLILLIPLIIIIAGTVGMGVFATTVTELSPEWIIVLIIGFLCLIMPISMFVNAVLQSYLGSAWTLTYRRITGREFGGVDILPEEAVVATISEESAEEEDVKVKEVKKKKKS